MKLLTLLNRIIEFLQVLLVLFLRGIERSLKDLDLLFDATQRFEFELLRLDLLASRDKFLLSTTGYSSERMSSIKATVLEIYEGTYASTFSIARLLKLLY